MSKGTEPITYHYNVDGHDVAVSRRHVGTAYAANGNVGNPTEYFLWEVEVDGNKVMGSLPQRAVAYEYGRAHVFGVRYNHHKSVGVRPYWIVAAEMKSNYVKQSR